MDEKEYYQPIKTKIEELLSNKYNNFYLEITAEKKFSDKLKVEIPKSKDIIFSFLKDASPDITGFIRENNILSFIVIEFKKDKIKLDNIYQVKKYIDLFSAKFAFLISLKSVPEEIKRLDSTNQILSIWQHWSYTFTLTQFDEKTRNFTEWYPKNPFLS
jgi:hypothetical protein